MQYRKLGSSDLNCSVIGLGGWGFGDANWGEVAFENAVEIVRAALDAGVNFIDTAQTYGMGRSERVIAEGIKGYDREKLILADKCGVRKVEGVNYFDWRPEVTRSMLEQSLKDLQTDYIDLYQVHWPNDETPLKEAFEELNRIREEGLIRYVGVSNFSIEQMEEARLYCPIVSLQPQYSLLHRQIEEDLLPYCIKKNIGVISYGSIASGVLSGKYTARPQFSDKDPRQGFYQAYYSEENWPKISGLIATLGHVAEKYGCETVHIAIAWVLAQKGVTVAICGARDAQQARVNAKAADIHLSQEDLAYIQSGYVHFMG
ncbi:MAG: aldo/keto reductase [Christensenellales bacterium]|jgi:aryl-alcohol dehydrogenase-like predicted oxidoreductase